MEFEEALIPADFTDVGQAKSFYDYMGNKILYVKGPELRYYTGKYWKCKELLVQKALQHFTYKQPYLAWKLKNEVDSDEDLEKAKAFYKFVLGRRKSSNIKATLTELKPMVQQDLKVLSTNGFLLNTPAGTVDLATGKLHVHDPKDYCIKITKTAPDDEGVDEWLAFLERFTCSDKELEAYLQLESGMESIEEVFNENLIVQYGSGSNGKSAYNNAKFIVPGDYAGTISAELLTVCSGKNKGAELAHIRCIYSDP